MTTGQRVALAYNEALRTPVHNEQQKRTLLQRNNNSNNNSAFNNDACASRQVRRAVVGKQGAWQKRGCGKAAKPKVGGIASDHWIGAHLPIGALPVPQ